MNILIDLIELMYNLKFYINVCGNSKRLTWTFYECTAEKIEPKKVEPTKAAPGAPEKGGVTVKGLETRKQICTLFIFQRASKFFTRYVKIFK